MSLLADLEKMDTDLKQVRTDTNVALTEKGGTEVQNLNEIAEAVRGLPSGGGGFCWEDYSVGYGLNLRNAFQGVRFPEGAEITIKNVNELDRDLSGLFNGARLYTRFSLSAKKAIYPKGDEKKGYFCSTMFNGGNELREIDFSKVKYNENEDFMRIYDYSFFVNACANLTRIKGILGLVGAYWNTFSGCSKLKDITIAPDIISYGFNIAQCPALSPESVQSIIDGLATVTSPQTLTLHKNIVLTAEQKETIRTKGWTLAQ